MATLERDILDKVGKYNLSTLEIISYRQDKEESKPKTMDIRGITLQCLLQRIYFLIAYNGSIMVYDTQDIRSLLLNRIRKIII